MFITLKKKSRIKIIKPYKLYKIFFFFILLNNIYSQMNINKYCNWMQYKRRLSENQIHSLPNEIKNLKRLELL